ncbi:citrate synthase-like protein [Ascoidea rubescens DSM 1968]|uniref:Citrate synthase n=1 Tax=Ascoidea rubescens DSM 1968 TaxID=1344418 RepID=A0A1D2VCV8_9ASCO|nr:citrate synthase-like protein [Ascoidea rubescens DSM 1968]ODV59412.1 citrate synthase-like protein [Ascoidea rubescens DSM 1968]
MFSKSIANPLLASTVKSTFKSNLRTYATAGKDLKSTLISIIPERKEAFLKVKKEYSDKTIGELTVGQCLGGMRGTKSLYWESSVLDPNEGIRFHNKTIDECQEFLPKSKHEIGDKLSIFLPESMFWYLLTGQVPTQEQVNAFSKELAEKAELPAYCEKILDSLPSTLHPMTQMSIAISALNHDSLFAKAYEKGIAKADYWEYVFDDVINLIAKLPAIAGKIYQNTYKTDILKSKNTSELGQLNKDQDWSYNIASFLGMTEKDSLNINNFSTTESKDFVNLVRLYCALHGDHEGGNVSSHATHLVGSALSDPYLSYSAGIQGLAGPLHGLAAQEVVRFITTMKEKLVGNGDKLPSDEKIVEYLWSILNSGRVIPGYGHAVLRKPDPRFKAMLEFGLARPSIAENDIFFQFVHKLSQVAPGVLTEHGKTKNPYPNVDSGSGILFYHYGIKETLYFTVIFGCSRALGPLNQLIWDRILGLPIERPKSIDLATIAKLSK